jgi:hypothetical protein
MPASPPRTSPPTSRLGSVALLAAAVYSVGLVLAGVLVPVYSSQSVSSTGEVTQGSATLVEVNGFNVLVVLAVPLLVTLAVGAVLWPRVRRGAMPVAWILTGVLAAFNLVAMLSIGVFVLPVTGALLVACGTRATRH